MSSNPAISIIIPCYNVEAFLARAVESIHAQTFTNWEMILVDDGSPDNSGAVCDALAAEDARIRVIHQANAGAASARNAAIAQATGEFLYFMDGDDWCEPTMLADMHAAAVAAGADLLVTGFTIDTYYGKDKYYREMRNAPTCTYATQQEFRKASAALFDAQLLYAPWNKLYRHAYLKQHGILFPTTFWDDLPFNLDVMRNIEHVACLDGHYYHFLRARADAENTKYRPDMYAKREEEHQWLLDLYAYWQLDTPEIREFLSRRYAERLVGCIENVTTKSCTLPRAEKRAQIAQMISTPQAREALRYAQPHTAMMRQLLRPLKSGNVGLAMLQSQVISWVRQNCTSLFARLKANR